VDSLDLSVERGEVFGFLGPNGAGKTTTIRMLLDFIRPTAGTLTVLGGSGADPAIRRRIGYLPGDLSIDPRYSGNDLFQFYARLRGGVEGGEVAHLCKRFNLDPTRPSDQLSTGNRRKIGIVQAFMHRPDLLILDEPTSGLDPLLQNEFMELVRENTNRGCTVFLSSHLLAEVEALADRVGVLRQGALVTVATIDELRSRARHRLRFHVADAPDAGRFANVAGVVSAEAGERYVEVVVEGSVDAALKAAATMEVIRLETPGDDLAEMFVSFYEGNLP
jgi:ABC-2 type transport system ATP-binding protein